MRWILLVVVALLFAGEARGGEDEELFRKCVDSFHHRVKLLEKVELVYVVQVIRADSFDDLMKGHKKVISLPSHVDYKTNGVSTLCRRHNPGDIEGRLLIRKDDFQIDVSPDQGQMEISETSTNFDGHLWNEFRPILDLVHQCREGGSSVAYEDGTEFQNRLTHCFRVGEKWKVQFDPGYGMGIVAIQQIHDSSDPVSGVTEIYFAKWKEVKPGCWSPTHIINSWRDEHLNHFSATETMVSKITNDPVIEDSELAVKVPEGYLLNIDSSEQRVSKSTVVSIHQAGELILYKRLNEVSSTLFQDPLEAWDQLKRYPDVRTVLIQWGVGVGLFVVVVVSWLVWGRRKRVTASGA